MDISDTEIFGYLCNLVKIHDTSVVVLKQSKKKKNEKRSIRLCIGVVQMQHGLVVHCSTMRVLLSPPNPGAERRVGYPEEVFWRTHNDGATSGLAVKILVAKVEDKCCSAVQESKHTNTNKELSRGREIALQEGLCGLTAVTCWDVVWVC